METLEALFSQLSFHPVIHFPEQYDILDLGHGYTPDMTGRLPFSVGKYDERRLGMYTTELFTQDRDHLRDVHIGIDLGCPAGTPVHAFDDGTVFCAAINPAAGDYGGTIITFHEISGKKIWVLHGHLSHASVKGKKAGDQVIKGSVIGEVGVREENGGWNPHLHFQISLSEPVMCDMPGAVSVKNREAALNNYPDPRIILGKLY